MRKYPSIKNIMTPDPITVSVDESVTKVIQKIKENDFDHLPVVDKWNNLLGIISKTDLYKKALDLSQGSSGKTYAKKILFITTAADIMTAKPVFVTPEDSLDYAIELLLQGNFHALPVVEDYKLLGIITSKDVLEFMIDEKVITA